MWVRLLVAVAALGLLPSSALAGTVDVSGGTLVFAGGDEANRAAVYEHAAAGPGRVLVSDESPVPVAISEAGRAAGCTHLAREDDGPSTQDVVCPRPAAVRVDGGAGSDLLAAPSGIPNRLDGGPGDDRLTGSGGADELHGGDGRDELDGAGGDDRLHGEGGDDLLHNHDGDDVMHGGDGDDVLAPSRAVHSNLADGADQLSGGAGRDELSYKPRTSKIEVTFDGRANDGKPAARSQSSSSPAEADNVASDIEIVQAGGGTDVLVGDARANEFRGGGDFDQLRGGAGDDILDGQGAGDIVHGEEGDDRLIAEVAVGGPGSDHIEATRMAHSRDDERDTVECVGTGTKVTGDRLDRISGSCESVEREAPAPKAERPSRLRIVAAPGGFTTSTIVKRGLFVEFRCPTGCSVATRLLAPKKLARRLGLSSRAIGAARRTFGEGDARLRVRITKTAGRRLRRVPNWTLIVRGKATSGRETYPIAANLPVRSP